jgi:hypothetical protein
VTYRIYFDRPRAAVEQLGERLLTRVEVTTRAKVIHTGRLVSVSATSIRLDGPRAVINTDRVSSVKVLTGSWRSSTAHGKDTKTERFTLRMRPRQLSMIRRAAHIAGSTMSAFILTAAIRAAKDVLARGGYRR